MRSLLTPAKHAGKTPFFDRFSVLILVSIGLTLPGLFYAAKRAVQSNTNRVQDWIPKTFTETGELAWFREQFLADQFVVVSWEGCRLGGDPTDPESTHDDPRIEMLAQRLVPEPSAPRAAEYRKYFRSVNTARRVLNRVTAPPTNVPYGEAMRRLQGSLVGPDGRQTAVIVFLTDTAVKDFRSAIGRGVSGILGRNHKPGLLFEAMAECQIPFDQAHMGGPPVDNLSIDEEGDKTIVRLVAMAMVFGVGLAWFSLRSLRLTLIVFVCGLLSATVGLAIVQFRGNTTDAVLLSMPSLLYILAISGSIHLINYYRDEVAERGQYGAPDRALAHGWRPTLLCNLTTSIGLASLYSSEIVPIRKFGVYSALGVIAMLGVLFLYLPAALTLWPAGRKLRKSAVPARPTTGFESRLDRLWARFGGWVVRHHWAVSGACALVAVFVTLGLTRVHTTIDLLKLFHPKCRILHDYVWLEQHLGRLVPMEMVLRFPAESCAGRDEQDATGTSPLARLSFLERIESVALIQQVIARQFGVSSTGAVGPSTSALTFAPSIDSKGADTLSFARRSGLNARLEASRDEFTASGFYRVDPEDDAELWRVSLRIAAFQDIDYGAFVQELRQVVEPVVAAHVARQRILTEIIRKRPSKGYAGATVLLWDCSGHLAVGEGPADIGLEAQQSQLERLFSESLRTLLKKARLRVAVNRLVPATVPLTHIEQLVGYDCVVPVGEFADADVDLLRRQGVRVVDIRDLLKDHLAAATLPDAKKPRRDSEMSVIYTGVVPIVYKAQRSLLDSLIESTFWSFVTITPLMMFVTRSVSAGSIAMLPNLLPVLVVFGGMGWLNVSVDIGSMMSASIALGVAVDDTIHFMTWFRDDLDRTGDRRSAILAAYRRCATPTTQAALVNGLGLAVFATSTFMPTRKFGWLMLTILVAGLVAELVLTPALLAGPLGSFFRPRKRTTTTAQPGTAAPKQDPRPGEQYAGTRLPSTEDGILGGKHREADTVAIVTDIGNCRAGATTCSPAHGQILDKSRIDSDHR